MKIKYVIYLLMCTSALAGPRHREPSVRYFDIAKVRDFSGNGNTATNYGASLHEASTGWAANFDGVSNYVDIGSPFDGLTNYSYNVWASNITDTNNQVVFLGFNENGLPANENIIALYIYQGELYAGDERQNDNAAASTIITWDVMTRHMYTVTADSSYIRLYVDGVQKDQTPLSSGSVPIIGDVEITAIGARGVTSVPVSGFFPGTIDSVSISSVSVYSSEVYQVYANATDITNQLVAVYPMQPEYK